MGTPRGVQTRYSLVRTGLLYSNQTRIDSFRQSLKTGIIRGPNSDHLLPKQSDKARSIVSSGKRFSSKKVHRRDETTPSLPLRVLESTLGLLGATYPTVPWGRLYLRKLQGQVLGGIAKGRSVTNMVEISHETRDHLQFWLQYQVRLPGVQFLRPPPAKRYLRMRRWRVGE